MLFYAFYPVNLASYSSALTPYETSCINQYYLASFIGLYCVATTVLDAFHIWPSQSLRLMKVGIEPTAFWLKVRLSTLENFQPTAMCWLSCCILFWNTQYNTPRTFCLASYSVVFRDHCLRFTTQPTTTKTAYKPLGATLRTNMLPFLIPTDWLVT